MKDRNDGVGAKPEFAFIIIKVSAFCPKSGSTATMTASPLKADIAKTTIRVGECGNVSYRRLHLLDRDQARAFELTRRVLVARAPEEILVIEAMARLAQYGATLTSNNFVLGSDGHGGTIVDFTSATSVTGGHGHGNTIASPVKS